MDKLSYKDFMTKLSQKAKPKHRLLEVLWELTYQCNLNCRHCYVPHKKRKDAPAELSLKQVKNIIDQLYSLGCLNITLTGGEIFTRHDALQILEYLKDKGFHISLLTNGTLITEETSRLMHEFSPPVDLAISLYSLKEKINSRIVGVKGALAMVLNGISILKQKEVPFTIGMLVMRDNLREFQAIKEFARKQLIHFQYDYIVRPRLDGAKDVLQSQISLLAIQRLRKKEHDFLTRNGECKQLEIGFSKNRLFYCDAGSISMAINPYGQANICLDLPLPEYDVLNEGVLASWQKVVKFMKQLKPTEDYHCYKCKLGDFCSWCPAMAWRHKNNLNYCVPFYKRLSEMERKAFYAQG